MRSFRRFQVGLRLIITLAALLGMVQGIRWVMQSPVEAQGRSPLSCDRSVAVTGNTAVTLSLVAPVTSQRIAVCGFVLNGAGATTATLIAGTGALCGTATRSLTGAFKFIDGSNTSFGNGSGAVVRLAASERLCWTNSGAVQVSGLVTYGVER